MRPSSDIDAQLTRRNSRCRGEMAPLLDRIRPLAKGAGRRSMHSLPAEPDARALVEQLPAILYVADPGVNGRWHYVSRGAPEILGFSPEEWTADPELWARQIHPEDGTATCCCCEQASCRRARGAAADQMLRKAPTGRPTCPAAAHGR